MTKKTLLLAALAGALTACSSNPPAPDWQSSSLGAMKSFTSAYLTGNTLAANQEFARARFEVASTARADLVARAELIRCAAQVASLVLEPCAGFDALAQDAGAPERAYAAYLAGRQSELDANALALLPAHHRALVAAKDEAAQIALLSAIKEPLARLVGAGVLMQTGQLTPKGIDAAVDTASEQGWRRPLLAWLGAQFKRADAVGDVAGKARIQRRIDLALTGPAPVR